MSKSSALGRAILVVDTSSLIAFPELTDVIQDHDIYIPLEVLEELDKLKTYRDVTGASARQVNRRLDALRKTGSIFKGVITQNNSRIFVISTSDLSVLPPNMKDIVDNRIIAVAKQSKAVFDNVTLVSEDIALRVKCDALKIDCCCISDLIAQREEGEFTGVHTLAVEESIIDTFYAEGEIDPKEFDLDDVYYSNEFLILKSGQQSALARVWTDGIWRKLHYAGSTKKFKVQGIRPRNKEQTLALELLLDPGISMVTLTGMAGCGKAQPLYSRILTPDGWVKMGDIKLGSKVLTPDGSMANVIGVFPQGKKDVYKITFSDGTSAESCIEHLWLTRTQRDRDYNRKGEVKSLEEISKSLRNKNGKRNHSIPIVSPIEFDFKELKIDPYILGCLLGDGYIKSGSPCLSSADNEILDFFADYLPSIGCKISKINGSKYDYRITKDGNKRNNFANPLKEFLSELKLQGLGSEDKFIPKDYKLSSVGDRLSIIRGLMDTDGTVTKSGLKSTFTSTSAKLANDLAEIVRSLGGKATVNSRFTTYKYKGRTKIGKESFRVTISLSKEFCPFLLSRKANRWRPTSSVNLRKYIDKIDKLSKKETQCIMIDSKDHLYITDDYIVTHNTLLAIAAGLQELQAGTYEKIIISRPAESTSKEIGFLPGTKEEKMLPWLQPVMDNIKVLLGKHGGGYINLMFEKGQIEIEALSYIRGRTLPNTYFIIDESQNINMKEAKALITRMGNNSKIVLLGDLDQIDSDKLNIKTSGLGVVVDKFKEFEGSGHITLVRGERSKLATFAAKVM